MAGRSIGQIFVEISLDDKVYKQRLSEVQTGAVATAKGVETAWKALGTKSSEYFDQQRKAAQNAYTLIKESAHTATQDITRAHEAMTRRINELNQQQTGSFKKTNTGILDMASSFGLFASKAYLAYQGMHAVVGLFKASFNAVEDYKVSVASLASTLATFSERGKTDMAGAYKEAYVYASKLVEKIEEWDAKTVLTGKQLTSMVETMAMAGVVVDVNNKKHEEGVIAIGNAIALVTKGQNVELQLRQEIRGLMDGEVKATNKLAQMLDSQLGGTLKEHIKLWRSQGTIIENVGALLAGYSEGAKDLENTWAAVGSTLETIANKILRDAFQPIYEDIIKLAKDYTTEITKGGEKITEVKNTISEGVNKAWMAMKGIVESVIIIWEKFPYIGKIMLGITAKTLDYLGMAATILPIIFDRIGDIVGAWKEVLYMVGSYAQALYYAATGQMEKAVKAVQAGKDHWAAAGKHVGDAFSTSLLREIQAKIGDYKGEAKKEVDELNKIYSSAVKPPEMRKGGKGGDEKETAKAAKEAAKAAREMDKALAELDILTGKTSSRLEGEIAKINDKYNKLKEDLKGNAEGLVRLEEWKEAAIKAVYAKQDEQTEKYFVDAAANYKRGYDAIAKEIDEGVKKTMAKLNKMGILPEEEQWAKNADDALKEMKRWVEEGSALGDEQRAREEEANNTFWGGVKKGYEDNVKNQQTTKQQGEDIWKMFYSSTQQMNAQWVDAFIRGENVKKSTMQIVGDSMTNLAGDISKKMYQAAIEKIIALIGSTIGLALGSASGHGALKGGAAGALTEIGILLTTGITSMLAGKAMASSFKAEGGWLSRNPGGGWIKEGSGTADDVFLGMTPGVRHWGMGGEFVVNKEAAERHAGLLRAINKDRGHAGGGFFEGVGVEDSWEPVADLFVMGTLASALHGFWKGFIPGAIAEAIIFITSAVGGAFAGKALAGLFGNMGMAEGGPIMDRGYFLGDIGKWINPFNNPITRAIGLPAPSDWGLPDPGEALADLLDPEAFLEKMKEIIREPFKQVAKDILTPGKLYSDPLAALPSALNVLEKTVKSSIGLKHSGGMFMPGEQLAIVQTGEGVLSHRGMANLAALNLGHAEGGELTPEEEAAQELAQQIREAGIELVSASGLDYQALLMTRQDELAVMHPTVAAIQALIWKREDEANSNKLNIALLEAMGLKSAAVTASRWEELRALSQEDAYIQQRIYAAQDAAELRAKEIELLQAQGKETEALAMTREDELKGMNSAMQALQKQIYAAEDAAAAEEKLAEIREAEAAQQTAIWTSRRSLQIRLAEAQGNEEYALFLKRKEEMDTLKKETMDAVSASLLIQIWAIEDAKKAEEALAKVREEEAKATEAAAAAIQKQLDALKTSGFSTKVDYLRAYYHLLYSMPGNGGGSSIPAFAGGGYHSGGWRVVGERGPELEYTGPGMIYPGDVAPGGPVLEEIREIILQLGVQVVNNTGNTYKKLDKWDGEGLPDAASNITAWGN